MLKLNEEKRRLFSNFFALSILQGTGFILPLITLPYLVRVLGVEKYGLINLATAIIMYFNICVSFGFDLSATRDISVNRDDPAQTSRIFSSVIIVKLLMLLLSLSVLACLVVIIDSFRANAVLYLITFGVVIGNALFPTWYFQGVEHMKYITYLNLCTKLFFTVLVFVLVRKPSDYLYVAILNSFGSIAGGLLSLYLVRRYFRVRMFWPGRQALINQFNGSCHFFVSRVANDGSRYYATTMIGLFFGNTSVGYYCMVEKLFYAFSSLGGIVSQTLYPYMSRTKNIKFYKKVFFSTVSVSAILVIALFTFRAELLSLVFNSNNEMLLNLFVIVFSGAIFVIISALLGYPLLAAFGYINHANNSLILAALLYIVFITSATLGLKDIYIAAFSIVVYEMLGALFRIYYVKKLVLWRVI